MMILLYALLAVTSWSGEPTVPAAPTSIVIGAPVFETDCVRIPITVYNPSCCHPTTFAFPGFDPTWGICVNTSVGLDWEVDWFNGVEYLDVPHPAIGKMACGWFPPDHNDQWWPDREDIGTTSGNYWKVATRIQNDTGVHTMAGAKSFGTVGYAYNDDGVQPRGPADLVWDYAGTSGGNHVDHDPLEELEYGPDQAIGVTAPSLRMILDCEARVCFAVSVIWHTAVTVQSDAILHLEVRYALQ